MNNKNFTAFTIFVLLLALPSTAMAYIDPASGSAIVSAIIGLIVAISLAIKTYWYKLKSIFIKTKPSETTEHLTNPKNDGTD